MLENLKRHIAENKNKLTGEWIKNNSSYDSDICGILDMEENTKRYWDAKWEGLHIEFKKGNSIWIDLVRYSESILKTNRDSSKETVTIFFIPNKNRDVIEEIICVKTNKIIKKINLTKKIAEQLVSLNDRVPRSLNAQANLTKKDVREISSFIV